ncbi:MAG TPA: tRNA (guanosine(37)-N1)-methyltransferase TrmD [Myxococcales bacterium]|nr:tRNA (guanosine(37)-N1)-methyltransferase TrmD [Myxococcales bacterium]
MEVAVLTLFPRMVAGPLAESLLGKAQEKGLLRARVVDIRDFAQGKHRVTDDVPYGGGAGMVMKPEPLVAAIEAARQVSPGAHVVLLTPQGARFDQRKAEELARRDRLVLVCGRYEGVDERVLSFVDEELSLGDFILQGGEVGALAVIEAVARLIPGVLGNEESARSESFAGEMLLEGPQYTRPPEFRGMAVPEPLLSGDHARIARWRRQQALLRTRERRPDLFAKLPLSPEDRQLLDEKKLDGSGVFRDQ